MAWQDILDQIFNWMETNLLPLVYVSITIVIAYVLYIITKKQIERLHRKDKIDETTFKNLTSIVKILVYMIVIIILSVQISEFYGVVAGVFTAGFGTIVGFAAMNTIGNVIAGLIVMISRPFEVGDRIEYQERLADVIDVKLVYTVLKDIDGVSISVPNQTLLKTQIFNFGKNRIIRREIHVTPGFDVEPELVDKALLEAAEEFNEILQFPEPRVDVYNFLNFAVDYRLLVYINNSKLIPKFDHELRRAVLNSCKKHGIDISTPSLIMNVGKKESKVPSMDAIEPDEPT